MTWLNLEMQTLNFCGTAMLIAVNWLVQSTLLIGVGLLVARMFRRRGSAFQSAVYRTTLLAVLLGPIVSLAMAFGGLDGWSVKLPRGFDYRQVRSRDSLDGAQASNEVAGTVAPELMAESQRDEDWSGFAAVPRDTRADAAEFGMIGSVDASSQESASGSAVVSTERRGPVATDDPSSVTEAAATTSTRADVWLFHIHGFGLLAVGLVIVWVFVSGVLAIRLAVVMRQMNRLRECSTSASRDEIETCQRIASAMKIAAPQVLRAPFLISPFLHGLRHPAVMLPEETTLPLQDVFVHELAHLRRLDCFWLLLRQFATIVMFFQPLLLWLGRRIDATAEEVCDDFVVQFGGNRECYANSLVDIAALSARPMAIAGVGMVSLHSMLSQRVGRIMDTSRSLSTRVGDLLLVLVVSGGLAGTMVAGFVGLSPNSAATVAISTQTQQSQPQRPGPSVQANAKHKSADNGEAKAPDRTAHTAGPTLRGTGKDAEMLLWGRVLDTDGSPANDFEMSINVKRSFRGDAKKLDVSGNEFQVWIPVGGNDGLYVELSARSKDGHRRATQGIEGRQFHDLGVDGIQLQLDNADRIVTVTVAKDGRLIAGAHIVAEMSNASPLRGETNGDGKATFALLPNEELSQLTAWTDDYLIGGYSFSRKPRRDPLGSNFEIELEGCRDQTIRFIHASDGSPVANVAFNLVLGTGKPNYNFAAVPNSFPHAHMVTDPRGESVCRWFPDLEQHSAYVEIVDPNWAKALEELETAEDGGLVMKLKPRVHRKPLVGKVISETHDVGGLMLQIRTFQGEEEGFSDYVYAFTDANGDFSAECIPGSTYCVCVNDTQLVSNTIDLIPYEPVTGKSNRAELTASAGEPVEIRVTSGPDRRPMSNTSVHCREIHDYSWYENGEERSGSGGRTCYVHTNEQGVAVLKAIVGSNIEISVYAGDWRSGKRKVVVSKDKLATVEFHREVDVERSVAGRLVAPKSMNVDLAGAEIFYGSIDGETDEEATVRADRDGQFSLKTRAIQLGFFAYTADGKAAGALTPDTLTMPIEIELSPTADLQGQLLGKGDEPLVNHAVRVNPVVRGKSDQSKSFFAGFSTKTFETITDNQGNYTFKQLPTGLDITLQADAIDGADDVHLDSFFLVPGEERPRMISRLDESHGVDTRSLAEKYSSVLRDANLNGFHLLVMIFDSTSDDFTGRYLMDYKRNKEAMSYMNLRIFETDVTDEVARKFVESHDWPQPRQGSVFVCALDGEGNELGRATLDATADEVEVQAAEFLKTHAPIQADATAKWDAAFAEARSSGRKVWARVGQRYCGPCFRFSRWLDDNRERLERDYVLLKIDNARDEHGVEIAKRIVSNRDHFGIPFHAIFDAQEKFLIDSEGPTGNIGHPAGFEGRLHLKKMLTETKTLLTQSEIDELVSTPE